MGCLLNIGCDFSDSHIRAIMDLLDFEKSVENPAAYILSVYGSPKVANPFGSVRPFHREKASSTEQFTNAMKKLKENGVEIKLTLNSLFPHLKDNALRLNANIFNNLIAKSDLLYLFERLGEYVDSWVVAHPAIIDIMHNEAEKLIKGITVSTVMNVHSVQQVQWIERNWPLVTTICPALWKNRDFDFLRAGNAIIPFELLANEFCSVGGVECEGLYRQSCYLSQSTETSQNWNPMLTRCISSRKGNPVAWLKSRFILPQWLNMYRVKTGVKIFKITGRTHTEDFVRDVGKAYISGKYEGNLLGLWGQLQATLNRDKWNEEQYDALKDCFIDVGMLDGLREIIGNCTDSRCGLECRYCESIGKMFME